MQTKLNCVLIAHTPEPERIIATAARLCYSEDNVAKLMENMTNDKIVSLITTLENIGHCYDSETEVLTESGFKKWPLITSEDKLASIDPKTMAVKCFEKPIDLISEDYNGEMITFNNNEIDLCVTPNHKIYCSLSKTEKQRKYPIFSLHQANEKLSTGKHVYQSPMRMIKCAINNNTSINDNDLMYALYGFFVGDGHTTGGNQILFHLKLKRKIVYLTNLCKNLGLTLKENLHDKFAVEKTNIGNCFKEMFYDKNKDKTFPNSFFSMTKNQFKHFIDGLKNSDGSVKRNTFVYDTTSFVLAEKLQTLGALNETVFSIKKGQTNVIRLNANSRRKKTHLNVSRKPSSLYHVSKYSGKIYCATVSTGLLIVRRNDKIVLCGNSSPFEHASWTFAIEGISRTLSHQLVRHRIASPSQKSQRYVLELDADFVMPLTIENNALAKEAYLGFMKHVNECYSFLTSLGIPKEDARYVLSNATETKLILTINTRSLYNFFNHRCCKRAQWEIRALANMMLSQVKAVAPTIFRHAGAKCVKGYCPEAKMSCGHAPTLTTLTDAYKKQHNC